MRKNKREYRAAKKQGKKVVKMIRRLNDYLKYVFLEEETERVERIFKSIQAELDLTRRIFYTGSRHLCLSEPFDLQQDMQANPHISIPLPDDSTLTAVAFQQEDYPSINIYLEWKNRSPELICFAEYNSERSPCHMVCIGAYQSNDNETTYYEPYEAEREKHEQGKQ